MPKTHKTLLKTVWTFLLLAAAGAGHAAPQPNLVVIFTDDQGYQDLGCFGSPTIKTPRLDQMAAEGLKLTDFYVTTSVCSASRASLLTGRYPAHSGVASVFFPHTGGLHPRQVTIAEALKPAGYRSGCFGKWHLGDQDHFMPTNQGFEAYYGVPFSNDMYLSPSQKFAEDAVFRGGFDREKTLTLQKLIQDLYANNQKPRPKQHPGVRNHVPIVRGNRVVEFPADQGTLTQRYFDEAIAFADRAGDAPFFLFITPSMPHIPLFASEAFEGTSERGLYGDVIEEIDHHVGRLIDHLRRTGELENTLILFTSDNGPWLAFEEHGGSAEPLRDGKFSSYEGGVRVPAIAYWPGQIPAGSVSSQPVSTVDLLPTFLELAGATIPDGPRAAGGGGHHIDGISLADWIKAPSGRLEERPVFFWRVGQITGVRLGDFKLLPHGGGRRIDQSVPAELYNLRQDPGETDNLAARMPEKVKALQALIDAYE